jgi:hypothetical protein
VQLVGGDAELLGDLGVGGAAMQAVLQGDVGLLDLPRSRSYFSIASIRPKMP